MKYMSSTLAFLLFHAEISGLLAQQLSSAWASCVELLALPRYPTLALGARVEGKAQVKITFADDGTKVINVTGVPSLLANGVRAYLAASQFKPCRAKTLSLQFDFVIEGKPRPNPATTTFVINEGHFLIKSPPSAVEELR
jgi:hypothetical protein